MPQTEKEMKMFKLVFLVYFLFIGNQCLLAQQSGLSLDRQKIDGMKGELHPINSSDYSNLSRKSLLFLKKAIGNKRIVFLGEQTHHDGTTREIVFGMLKFLHEEMGFKVLVVERSLFGTYRKRQIIRNRDDFIVSQVDQRYFEDKDKINLLDYVYKRFDGADPGRYVGIDIFNNVSYEISFYNEAFGQIDPKIIGNEEWKSFTDLLRTGVVDTVLLSSVEEKCAFYTEVVKQSSKLPLVKKQFLLQTLRNRVGIIRYRCHATPVPERGGKNDSEKWMEHFAWRDIQMADNLRWVIETLAPNEKIIVWTSTYHISRNIDKIAEQSPVLREAKPMGHLVWEKFKNDIYSIAFVPTGGKSGYVEDRQPYVKKTRGEKTHVSFSDPGVDSSEVTNVAIPENNSFEGIFNQCGMDCGFLDFSRAAGNWVKGKIYMCPTFDTAYAVDWTNVYDGIVFIKKMQPEFREHLDKFLEGKISAIDINHYLEMEH